MPHPTTYDLLKKGSVLTLKAIAVVCTWSLTDWTTVSNLMCSRLLPAPERRVLDPLALQVVVGDADAVHWEVWNGFKFLLKVASFLLVEVRDVVSEEARAGHIMNERLLHVPQPKEVHHRSLQ